MDTKTVIFRFVEAIQNQNMVLVKFQAKSNHQVVLRKCAPLDIAPSKRAKNQIFKFHMWDFDNNHVLSLEPSQILDLDITAETFQPEDIITWSMIFAFFILRAFELVQGSILCKPIVCARTSDKSAYELENTR